MNLQVLLQLILNERIIGEKKMKIGRAHILLILLISTSARPSFASNKSQWPANIAITTQLSVNTIYSIKHHQVKSLVISNLINIGLAEITKRVVHEQRPNGKDSKSFYSEHTALACGNASYNYWIGLPVCGFVGEERVRTDWHYTHDVMTGGSVGLLIDSLVRYANHQWSK